MKPIPHGANGHYAYASKTGTIAAALAAGAVLFAFRWTHATVLAVITRMVVRFQPNVVFTAAGANLSLAAYVGRSYSASHTGGTAATLTGNNCKRRTSFATTKAGDIRIATTAALGGGTITVDAQPFKYGGPGRPNWDNAAAGTPFIFNQNPVGSIDYIPDIDRGEYPLVLAQNEGIVLKNEVVWPAAGTAEVSVEIDWAEVDAY